MMVRSRSPRSHRDVPGERAFSLVEVIVSIVILTVVIAAATSVFTSSTRATSTARVADKQTSVSNAVLARMQSDTSWALACNRRRWTPTRSTCSLTTWAPLRGLGVVRESNGNVYRFGIVANAIGVDLPSDGRYPNDTDGVLPDVWRLRVTITPDPALMRRHPGLKATTLQQDTNPAIRVNTGRVTINACLVVNQVDERAAAGDCVGASQSADMTPPGSLDTTNASTIRSTCRGQSANSGGRERDCTAYKCAEPTIAQPNPGLAVTCASQSGWSPTIFRQPWSSQMTAMLVRTAPGTVTLRRQSDGTRRTERLSSGTAQFNDMPVGTWEVLLSVPGYERWTSKSVPASNLVGVSYGMNSRAVLMFRPTGRGQVRIRVRSVDNSGPPWMQRSLPGYVGITDSGSIRQGGFDRICLVPVPKGRLLQRDNATQCVNEPYSVANNEFVFNNVEPGLYSFQLADPTYVSFKTITNTAGFIYVPPGGRTYYGVSTRMPEYYNGLCARDVRRAWVAGGPIAHPTTGQIWRPQPCDTPSGPGPGPQGGGGGSS